MVWQMGIVRDGNFNIHLSRIVTKPTKWHVRPAKTQIILGIRPVWPESLLSAWRNLGSLATHSVHSEDWSDWANAQADLSFRWAHMPFCWFCHAPGCGSYLVILELFHHNKHRSRWFHHNVTINLGMYSMCQKKVPIDYICPFKCPGCLRKVKMGALIRNRHIPRGFRKTRALFPPTCWCSGG